MRYLFLLSLFAGLLCFGACRQNLSDASGENEQTLPVTSIKNADLGLGYEIVEPAFAELVDTNAAIEVLASGFTWSEGPVWVESANMLLFDDVPNNVTYRWQAGNEQPVAGAKGIAGVDTFFYPSGYFIDPAIGGEPGANGLVLDSEGKLLLGMHGARQVARYRDNLNDPNHDYRAASQAQNFEILASAYDSKMFNSPNDLVQMSNGDILFTDPTYGVDKTFGKESRELDFPGVYRIDAEHGEVELLVGSMTRPNGVVLTPDESAMIVANSDPKLTQWWRCAFADRPPTDEGPWCEVFADFTNQRGPDNPGNADGMVMHSDGTLFATGPGGVLCFSESGQHLGTIRTGRATANVTLGGSDGQDIYITANDLLLRARLR